MAELKKAYTLMLNAEEMDIVRKGVNEYLCSINHDDSDEFDVPRAVALNLRQFFLKELGND
jgi:hypothetical protein